MGEIAGAAAKLVESLGLPANKTASMSAIVSNLQSAANAIGKPISLTPPFSISTLGSVLQTLMSEVR